MNIKAIIFKANYVRANAKETLEAVLANKKAALPQIMDGNLHSKLDVKNFFDNLELQLPLMSTAYIIPTGKHNSFSFQYSSTNNSSDIFSALNTAIIIIDLDNYDAMLITNKEKFKDAINILSEKLEPKSDKSKKPRL